MNWLELSVEADAESVEAVTEVLERFGHGGVAIEEVGPFPEADDAFHNRPARPLRVVIYIPADDQASDATRRLEESLRWLSMIRPLGPLRSRTIAEADWATAWKEHFHVHRPGQRTVVVPSWERYEPTEGEVVVLLDPGMAFGTGLHPSTRLCVLMLEQRVQPGMAVLDLGTGSGILAVASAKMGAGRVLGLDIDPLAADVAEENVLKNGVQDTVQVEAGTLPLLPATLLKLDQMGWPVSGFDIVVANITARVIAELARPIRESLKPGGVALCSGIIMHQFSLAVSALLAAGLSLEDAVSEGDWRALALRAPE
ncbi:MAG: 50S ribosomal protein L11 methyltransferase [Chloroflexi bacterium]|nr:50S ribosomal protein L11 methyltransferase [Chloroflexota bacterium]